MVEVDELFDTLCLLVVLVCALVYTHHYGADVTKDGGAQ